MGKYQFWVYKLLFSFSFSSQLGYSQTLNYNFFSQSLYISKARDLISQNIFKIENTWKNTQIGQTYVGGYWDTDTKSDGSTTYTDKQLSPLMGHQTNYLFNYPVRFYTELRSINRKGNFPDNRDKSGGEFRAGLLTYRLDEFSHGHFIENYMALFYTTLYQHSFIFQGWLKQGIRKRDLIPGLTTDLLHEITADLNRYVQPNNTYLDYKPGIRIGIIKPGFQFYLLQQYAMSLAKRPGNRTPEWRSLVVLAKYF